MTSCFCLLTPTKDVLPPKQRNPTIFLLVLLLSMTKKNKKNTSFCSWWRKYMCECIHHQVINKLFKKGPLAFCACNLWDPRGSWLFCSYLYYPCGSYLFQNALPIRNLSFRLFSLVSACMDTFWLKIHWLCLICN